MWLRLSFSSSPESLPEIFGCFLLIVINYIFRPVSRLWIRFDNTGEEETASQRVRLCQNVQKRQELDLWQKELELQDNVQIGCGDAIVR